VITERILDELRCFGRLLPGESMARHTTFGVGGAADYLLKVASPEGLRGAFVTAVRNGVPCFVLGSGSNILVGDGGMRGLVIENESRSVEGPAELGGGVVGFRVDSGASFAGLSRRLCRAGYLGLEWAVGIPGTLGGAVVYNAGAYGGCLADVLHSVAIAHPDGRVEELPAAALSLEYRGSVFTRGLFRDRAILSVELRLTAGDADAIMQRVAELDRKRKAAQPPGRNAGSIFKNPPDKPAWWYIDQVGLRGARAGDAEISVKHANFFMNAGRARATDVRALMDDAVRRVRDRFGVELQPEVALVGEGLERNVSTNLAGARADCGVGADGPGTDGGAW
jgi:UDP-N-acetylmuramate dehydrogenase